MAAKVCVYRGVVSKNIRVYLPTGQKKTANKIGQWSWQWLVWDGPLWFFRISLKESFYWSTKSRICFVAQQNSGRKNVLKDLNIVSFLHPRGVPPILYYFFWWDLPSMSCLRSFWYLLGDSWFLDGLFVGFLMDYVDWFVWTAKKVTQDDLRWNSLVAQFEARRTAEWQLEICMTWCKLKREFLPATPVKNRAPNFESESRQKLMLA